MILFNIILEIVYFFKKKLVIEKIKIKKINFF